MKTSSWTFPILCPFSACPVENIQYNIYASVDDLPLEVWDTLVDPENYVMKSTYFRAMEASESDKIESRYLSLSKADRFLGFVYLQIVTVHRTGLNEESGSDGWRNEIGRYLKKGLNRIKTRVLVIGNMLVTGMYGIQLAKGVSQEEMLEALSSTINEVRKELDTTVIMVKDFEPSWNESTRILTNKGYQRVISQPTMEIDIRWKDWEEYMADLISKYRVRTKKIIKTSKALELRALTLADMKAYEQKIFSIYMDLISRAEFTMATAGPKFFTKMKEHWGDKYLAYGYFLDGELLGFLTGFWTPKKLESHFIGFDHSKIRSHSFYQRILQDFLRLAIDLKVEKLTYGRTAMEIKSTLGAEPKNMDTYMWAKNPVVHKLLPSLFDKLRSDDWVQRRPLKSQANKS